jgi:cell division protein ZapA (FtsZ GTPase activity inhibitor)
MRTVEVEIFNTSLTVRESENEAYLRALAAEVDARIQEIFSASQQISPLRAAIMAAYLFADEAKQQQQKTMAEERKTSSLPRTRASGSVGVE